MKRILMGLMAAALLVSFSAPSFAMEEKKKKEGGHLYSMEEKKKKEGGHLFTDEKKKKEGK